MYYVYSDGELIMETTDWDTACDTAILFTGYVADFSGEVLFIDEDADCSGIEFVDYPDLEMGFNPFCGCYDFDC